MSARGWRSTNSGYLERIASSYLAQPGGAGLGDALLGRTVDRHQAEHGPVPERPLEVVEGAPVRVTPHVEPVGQAPLHTLQGALDVLDALCVVSGADPVLGDE